MPHDLCLAIETSNPSAEPGFAGEVAVASCEDWSNSAAPIHLLAAERLSPASRHDDALAPAIDRACRAAHAEPRSLSRVAVSIGPGGFSALRIAIATAKMIGEATGAVCVPVRSADVAAWSVTNASRFAVGLASKHDTAWVAFFERADAPRPLAPPALMDAAALADAHARTPIDALAADKHLPAIFREWMSGAGVRALPLRLRADALLHACRGVPPIPAESLDVLYPREPEAVRKWRELGRSRHV